jgi:protein-arginine kinase
MSEIVISSRIRLARNLSGFPFLTRCTRHQRQAVEHKVRDTILGPRSPPRRWYLDLERRQRRSTASSSSSGT